MKRDNSAALALKAQLCTTANAQPQSSSAVDYGSKSQMAEWPVFMARWTNLCG
jgi:hypothetical protein